MRSGQITHFTPNRTDLFRSTPIQPYTFIQNHPAHCLFFYIMVITAHQHFLGHLIFFTQSCQIFSTHIVQQFTTQMFIGITLTSYIISFLVTFIPNVFTQFFIIYFVTISTLCLPDSSSQLILNQTLFFNGCMCKFNGIQHLFFRYFIHFAFHHHNIFVGSSYHNIQISLL